MQVTKAFLHSKVARRVFFLFVLCALLPTTVLAVLSFIQVTRQLSEESSKRLHQTSKNYGLSILERLQLLESELKFMAHRVTSGTSAASQLPADYAEDLRERFVSVWLVREGAPPQAVFGEENELPGPVPKLTTHMLSGKTALTVRAQPAVQASILMARVVSEKQPERGLLLARVNADWLWGVETLGEDASACVVDGALQPLFCTSASESELLKVIAREMKGQMRGQFAWDDGQESRLAGFWSLFLEGQFQSPNWTVVMSEPRSQVIAAAVAFKRIFPLVVLLSLLVVLFLSAVQIRRSLVPLEKLRAGTKHIAEQDFEARVSITSGDEFEELAGSFNSMASRLGKQFDTLTTIQEIDRAILSALDTRKIVETVLDRMPNFLPCRAVAVTLLEARGRRAKTYLRGAGDSQLEEQESVLTGEEVADLCAEPVFRTVLGSKGVPGYLAALTGRGMESFLQLPMFHQTQILGVITFGQWASDVHAPDGPMHVRQVADQVAVALANAHLIEDLNRLNWGTLTALARAIDAKSPWTAGHSERVTQLAVRIGREYGLPDSELEILHRGGLVHDIGKIGTPAMILNKPSKLDDEEFRQMKEHVRTGARILEPIPGFENILPIVLQHHERFDGTGYPEGLAGEAIHVHARIFAVADCFDALISDRPYRPGWKREEVIAFVQKNSGTHFDPKVVDAFLRLVVMEQQESREPAALLAT